MILIGLFGVAGVLCRYAIGLYLDRSEALPLATIMVNLIGCLLIGAVHVYAVEKQLLGEALRSAVMLGFLGGFTTFSAFGLDAFKFIERGQINIAAGYVLMTVFGGIACTFAGAALVRLAFLRTQ